MGDLKEYMVTVTNVGYINVFATNSDEALKIANKQPTRAIEWSDDWEATDVEIADDMPDIV